MRLSVKGYAKPLSLAVAAFLSALSGPSLAASTAFDYYGWFYVQYGLTSAPNDLAKLAPYTNTGFAMAPQQASLLQPQAFTHNFYVFNLSTILNQVYSNDGKTMPAPNQYGVVWHANYITDFRTKFFAAYHQYMTDLKNSLTANGSYAMFDTFYLADEPALHRNVFLDQSFLDQYVADFKTYMPGKKGAIPFAQDTSAGAANYARGPHYNPPSGLDLVMVDPYFSVSSPGQPTVACSSVQNWLYQGNPNSNINWAKQFGKPILVAGDGRLQGGLPLPDCYITTTYSVLKADTAIKGLVWWIYDKDYVEGQITGGGNSQHLVDLIAGLGASSGACYNASNYAHVTAGRAHNSVGYALANGSNQNMGLNNTFYTSKLRMTGANYYIIDNTCP
jgi:hypothetical protein